VSTMRLLSAGLFLAALELQLLGWDHEKKRFIICRSRREIAGI
jgi:hypothetical protein